VYPIKIRDYELAHTALSHNFYLNLDQ